MAVYKFDKDFKGCIEPMPGDIVELDGARLSVSIGDKGEGCQNCFLNNNKQGLLAMLCMNTICDGVIKEDVLDIHYEEVKDGE